MHSRSEYSGMLNICKCGGRLITLMRHYATLGVQGLRFGMTTQTLPALAPAITPADRFHIPALRGAAAVAPPASYVNNPDWAAFTSCSSSQIRRILSLLANSSSRVPRAAIRPFSRRRI